ncbi:hypothetical protein ACRYKS_21825 [Escherichia coli]|uniref:hypothetical protein n=1 Tax=Escherichia coli TaxID=562 RepID=UPI002985989D|nr:hypothetical protein [Escherichia coli]
MRTFNIDYIIDSIAEHMKNISKNEPGFYFNLDKLHRNTNVSSFNRAKKLYIRIHNLWYSDDTLMIDITVDEEITLRYIDDFKSDDIRSGSLPIDASYEEYLQYQFIDDTFGFDFELYNSIMNVYHVYEDYIGGRK